MRFLTSSNAPASPSAIVSIQTATVAGVQISLTLLEKVMDGTQIPVVKGLAGAAVEIIKIAKGLQANREECDDLTKRTTSLLVVILGSLSGKHKDAIPHHVKSGVERLTSDFQVVLAELQVIKTRTGKSSFGGLARAILYHMDNSDKLKTCLVRLQWAMDEFQVTTKVDSCLKDLERHEELRQGQKEMREEMRVGFSEIRRVVKEQSTASVESDTLPTTVLPPDPKIFGRHDYVEMAIVVLISNGSARLAILGPGGMGKTCVSLKIVHDGRIIERFGKSRYWVPCEQATSVNLLIELLAKTLNLPSSTSSDRFGEVVAWLEKCLHVHVLFVLDNFETPWDIEGQQSNVADILTRLSSIPSVSLILTMRGGQYPSEETIDWSTPRLPPLAPLDITAAQQAFLRISPDVADDPELGTLLQKLDCMPLALTLMAKLSAAGETISDLLSQWSSERTGMLAQPGGDRRNSIEVSIKLSIDSRTIKGNPDAIRLLSVLAMLPAGASLTQISDMCPSIPGWKVAIRVLRAAALVYDSADKRRVQMLSPIQSYVSLHHRLEQDALKDLRASYYKLVPLGKIFPGHPEFNEIAERLSKEEANMEAVLINALHDSSHDVEEALQVCWCYTSYLQWKQPRSEVVVEAIHVARAMRSPLLADCLMVYGTTIRGQGKHKASQPLLEEALSEYKKIGNYKLAARCQSLLGNILAIQGHHDKAQSLFQEARTSLIEFGATEDAAWCLWEIAQSFYLQRKYKPACAAFTQARSEFEDVNSRRGSASCLMFIGASLRNQGQDDEAQSALEKALTEMTEMGNHTGVARCFRELGRILAHKGEHSVALTKLKQAHTIYTQLGDISWIARCERDIKNVNVAVSEE
ncbi:hypothetical protein FRC03_004368 [Tulasnella sp. 419]|nr:hypothetical protein FRC03_004368 [Tulasnella sp. 419]